MGLNISKGNMYPFVTHTWNCIKGICPHGCTYCYMHRFSQSKVRFDTKELKTDLGQGNFIFVGSSCDAFAEDIHPMWIAAMLQVCRQYFENSYLFQSKNPAGFLPWIKEKLFPAKSVFCTTIETNRWNPGVMGNSPKPWHRVEAMQKIAAMGLKTYVTIEPVMQFDEDNLIDLVKACLPDQVNVGADSGGNNLEEPSAEKLLSLIEQLNKFTTVVNKKNLKRILDAKNM